MHNTKLILRPTHALKGAITVPGDKSLSHRAVMFGALADGVSEVRGWLPAGDTEASLASIRALGIQIDRHDATTLTVHGGKFIPPTAPLNLVNAGTGIRLLAGIMTGQPFPSVLDGSEQLRRRPMKRIMEPLRLMGANISAQNDRAPLHISPAHLTGIEYAMPMASAQVKSAVILAGLFAKGTTTVIEPGPARDHTELMLRAMGADLKIESNRVSITPSGALKPFNITVPADFSSAAFPIVAGCVVPDSEITITHVNLNPTRTGLLDVLLEMGANITVTPTGDEAGELVGDIHVKYSPLRGVTVGGEVVVRMIDELPVFMVAALCAGGKTLVRDAQELRVKETDRIAVMGNELRKLGAVIAEHEDGFSLEGMQKLTGAVVDGHDDHRIAMSMTVAGLVASGETTVLDAKCAGDSFPNFPQTMQAIQADLREEGYES